MSCGRNRGCMKEGWKFQGIAKVVGGSNNTVLMKRRISNQYKAFFGK
jgi:hypothetical protein